MHYSSAFNFWLKEKSTGLHHRQILLVELPFGEITPIVKNISNSFDQITAMSTEFSSLEVANKIPIARYQDYLGTETDVLFFDATSGIQLNALYAGAGMIRANGLLVILVAPCNQTNTHSNPFKFSYGYHVNKSYFAELLKDQIIKNNGAIISQSCTTLPSTKVVDTLDTPQRVEKENDLSSYSIANENIILSTTQTKIADEIVAKITSNTQVIPHMFVILGARGRGKSTLLGIIAACLANVEKASGGQRALALTALHKNQLAVVNQVFTNNSTNSLGDFKSSSITRLSFFAPDDIISSANKNSIVFIDEVASISPDLLKRIVNHFTYIVMTGTTSGYEGSGNGFVKRVLPYFHSIKETIVYELTQPFRWLEEDPLEACFARILSSGPNLLTNEVKQSISLTKYDVKYRALHKQELIDDSHLYHQVFSLLSEAHYQTTPNDIVRILDANDCKIFVAQSNSIEGQNPNPTIIAVAVAFEEGGKLLEPMAVDISIGRRRVQGHLSAQALSLQLFSPDLCKNTYLRINRIAVLPIYCRNGVASQLLSHCQQYATQHSFDYMSVSFGYTQWLFEFWSVNGYFLAKVGQRIDTASGTASVLMLKPIVDNNIISTETINQRISLDLDYFCFLSPRLKDLYKSLIQERTTNFAVNEHNNELINLMSLLYVKKQINFLKFAPALHHLIGNNTALSEDKRVESYRLFSLLHKKGMHKADKLNLEKKLEEALFND